MNAVPKKCHNSGDSSNSDSIFATLAITGIAIPKIIAVLCGLGDSSGSIARIAHAF